jgi:hypothetical protein
LLLLSNKMSSVYHGTFSAEKFQGIKWIICKDYGTDEDDLTSIIDFVSKKGVKSLSFLKLTQVI